MRKLFTLLLATTFGLGLTGAAMAESQWDKDHPRRAEVNERLENQNKRINQEAREGEISKREAHKLRKEDRDIRKEERQMAAQHHGHLTKQDQRELNHEENAVSRQIGH